MAYQRPMVTVDQNMTVTPTSIERDQPAFICGPNYELHRYENDNEKAGCAVGAYDGSAKIVKYPNVIDDEAVDTEYTKLFGDNVVVKLADIASPEYSDAVTAIDGKNVECGKLSVDIAKDSLDVTAGSSILIKYSTDTNGESSGGVEARSFTSKVIKIDVDNNTEKITAIYIEDQITETVVENSLSAEVIDVVNGVEFTRKNLAANAGYQWEQGEYTVDGEKFNGVKVNAGALNALLSYNGEVDYYPVIAADLYISYRELITGYSDTIHSVTGSSDVANLLGTVDPDNPLAMGVYISCLNAATDDGDEAPPVFFMAVPEDNKDGYDAVLNKISLTDKVYSITPTTRDEAILEAVRNHVLAMSQKTVKQWRIGVVSAEVPEFVSKLNAKMDPDGHDFWAISPEANTVRVVKDSTSTIGNQDTKFRSTLAVGDKVKLLRATKNSWGEDVWDEYEIKRIVNNYTVVVKDNESGPLAISNTARKIEIDHPLTATEQAEEIAKVSSQMASRRMYNVFPSVFSSNGVTMTGEFAACAVAGLISATEPQQPITNMTVRGIDDIPLVYQTYNKDQLDLIASGGTFIVCQDFANDKVYVRHQISTAYPDGNLNTAELSITKNVDNISYAFAETFRPYYGKYNIVPGLTTKLWKLASTLLTHFCSSASEYGPQLLNEGTEILYIRQNELMKDHLDVGIRLGVPYPCNNIDIVLTV